MPIVPPLASPGSALAVASRPRQSGWRLLGIAPEQTGLELAQLPCGKGASKRAAPQRSRPSPVIGRP